MSKTEYTAPLPTVDRSQAYALQMRPVLDRMVAFLSSKATRCALPVQADAHASPLEFAPKQASTTFTRSEVLSIAREVVSVMKSSAPMAVRDSIPSYAVGAKATAKNIIAVLTLPYTPTKGKNEGVELNAALHTLAGHRRNMGRMKRANELAAVIKSGDAYFGNLAALVASSRKHFAVEANLTHATKTLTDKDGKARAFPSKAKANKAVARAFFGMDWFATSKADRLESTAKFVYGQSESVGKSDQHAVNGFNLTVLESTHHATVKKLARTVGAPASALKSKATAIQWFAEDVSRMDGLTQ